MKDLELKEALQEVLEHRQGKRKLEQRTIEVSPSEIQQIRQQYVLSQEEFANLFGVSVRTLQQWEQGRRHPQGPAQVLLKVIAHNPKAVQEALRH
ncbi:MAG: helix-turn-helix domain-containing protein [Alphaproteobacteria bacterium]|jgi:putative transcriptional regulator|nr:helix-turn-helix domain-containing protein [Alphaproteobacteria bacterium]